MEAPAIAAELTISEKTVYRHYQELEWITGCHNVTGLAVWWERHEERWRELVRGEGRREA